MNAVSRGIRNAFRNSIRTFSIVVILGLSVGLALAMLVARQAVVDKINTVKSSVGNTITVSPAGVQGFAGGGEPLTVAQLAKVSSQPNVTKVTETLNDRLTSDTTNLVSAIEPGSFGNRQAGNSGVGFTPPPDTGGRTGSGTGQVTRTFTPPVVVTGTNDVTSAAAFSGAKASITSGLTLDPAKNTDEALVGKTLAAKNNLSVGSNFTAYGKTIKVTGIYDSGNTFSNAGLVMSLPSLQRLSSQPNAVTDAVVTVNSIDNLASATSAIKSQLGTAADVVSNQDSANQAVAPLENVKSIALLSLLGALAAGAVIILLTMMMIVRERRREIGVMKAIGSSNLKTMVQFISEAVTLTVLGLIVGLVIGAAASSSITKVLVNNSTSNSASSQTTNQQGPGAARGRRGLRGFGNNSLTGINNIKASVGPGIIAYGAGAALVIAVVGSALPALFISRIRPAEVMRAD